MKDMPLNKDQSPLLKLFYKKKEIYVSDFEKYGMNENSQTFLSIRSAGYIKVGISYSFSASCTFRLIFSL